MPYAGCRYRVFIGKLCVIVTLPSVIRKKKNWNYNKYYFSGNEDFYKKYDELNIIFFYKDYMRLKKSAVKTDFFKR